MNKHIYILLCCFLSLSVRAQQTFSINNHNFRVETTVEKNDWNTLDTLNTLFRIEGDKDAYVLKFYTFKDEGGDCNNEFWHKESYSMDGSQITFVTRYFQKTGIDPIPEWRKQIYKVDKEGTLNLVYDKYKYYDTSEWVDQ